MDPNEENTIYRKVAHYCGYQERTEREVRDKLRVWGAANKVEEDHIVKILKQDHFLNEERYVAAFIRGKSLSNKWGKRKLLAALTQKGVDQALICKGLAAIENNDYLQSLRHVADQKTKALAGATPIQAKQKLTNYLLQKGYEPDLVHQTVQTITVQQSS